MQKEDNCLGHPKVKGIQGVKFLKKVLCNQILHIVRLPQYLPTNTHMLHGLNFLKLLS